MTKAGKPVLITAAAQSFEDQLARRKRKYLLMMSCRIPCLILAAILHDTWWLALAVLAVSVPLPWMAVLIANDRPPRKAETPSAFERDRSRGDGGAHLVVDAASTSIPPRGDAEAGRPITSGERTGD